MWTVVISTRYYNFRHNFGLSLVGKFQHKKYTRDRSDDNCPQLLQSPNPNPKRHAALLLWFFINQCLAIIYSETFIQFLCLLNLYFPYNLDYSWWVKYTAARLNTIFIGQDVFSAQKARNKSDISIFFFSRDISIDR